MKKLLLLVSWPLLLSLSLPAQRVDLNNTHYRLLMVDQVITNNQGRKVPAHADGNPKLFGYKAVMNASKTLAMVEMVADRHDDFDDIRAAVAAPGAAAGMVAFDKRTTKLGVFSAAARAAGFSDKEIDAFLNKSSVRVP